MYGKLNHLVLPCRAGEDTSLHFSITPGGQEAQCHPRASVALGVPGLAWLPEKSPFTSFVPAKFQVRNLALP